MEVLKKKLLVMPHENSFSRQALFQIDNSFVMQTIAHSADDTQRKTSCTEIVQSGEER
jgi:hypothetical protein